jgi:hypothetical protein
MKTVKIETEYFNADGTPADDECAAPTYQVDDSLKLIIDPFFNTLTMRGEVPDDFNLQDALKAAIEILERAQQGKK